MKKIFCILIICSIIFAPLAKARARLLDTKMQGKISLIILLTGIAALTKRLINSDKEEVEELHSRLGPPDRIMKFQQGFDNWRVEWYGEKGYLFRNEMLQNETIRGYLEMRFNLFNLPDEVEVMRGMEGKKGKEFYPFAFR